MQTICLGRASAGEINFALMTKRAPTKTISPEPLRLWLDGRDHGARADFASKLGLESQAVLTNWLTRGVPLYQIDAVAAEMGITVEDYRVQAGEAPRRDNVDAETIDIARKLLAMKADPREDRRAAFDFFLTLAQSTPARGRRAD